MKQYFYCIAIFAVMLYACNNRTPLEVQDVRAPTDQTVTANNKEEENVEKQVNTADTITTGTNNNIPSLKQDNPDWNKKIIKTADLQLQLDDYKKFNTSIHNSLQRFDAYIAEEKQEETDYKIENSITIKVPVEQFDALVNSFSGDGIKVREKNISSEDVTGEVVDTKARMQAKMAVRDKYLQLLKQAKNMNEILQVQNEINDIQENIEAANGRINYLQHAAAYSTLKLSYYQYINGSTPNHEKPDFFVKLYGAFSTGTSLVSNLVLFIISIWPLLLGVIVFLIYYKKIKLKRA